MGKPSQDQLHKNWILSMALFEAPCLGKGNKRMFWSLSKKKAASKLLVQEMICPGPETTVVLAVSWVRMLTLGGKVLVGFSRATCWATLHQFSKLQFLIYKSDKWPEESPHSICLGVNELCLLQNSHVEINPWQYRMKKWRL